MGDTGDIKTLFLCVVETTCAWGMNIFEIFMESYNWISLNYKTSFQNCSCSKVLSFFYFPMSSVLQRAQDCASVIPGKLVRK